MGAAAGRRIIGCLKIMTRDMEMADKTVIIDINQMIVEVQCLRDRINQLEKQAATSVSCGLPRN
jgi:hypothetical protein